MCAGDDKNCPEFELHHRKFKETLDRERRSFLKSSFAAAGGAAAMTAGGISLVTPLPPRRTNRPNGPITICRRMPTRCIGAISARN